MKLRRVIPLTGLLLLSLLLGACGGGTKSGAGVGTDPNASTVLAATIVLHDALGQVTTHLSTAEIATVVVTVKQTVTATGPNGPYTSTREAPGVQVTVQTSGGAISPSSGSVLTDSRGVAVVTLTVGNVAGAFQVTAIAAAANTTSGNAAMGYSIDQTLAGALSFVFKDAQGNAVTALQGGASYTIDVTATQTLTGLTGGVNGAPQPAPGIAVTFGSDGGIFDPTNGTVLTDAQGHAIVHFQPKLVNGAFVMTASATLGGEPVTTSVPYRVDLPQLTLGSGTPFRPGVLSLTPSHIGAGGTSTVTADIRNVDGTPILSPVVVTFTSGCATRDAATVISPVLSAGGSVNTVYRAGVGCFGVDTITAQILLEGATVPITASADILIDPPVAKGIVFVSVDHTVIVTAGHSTASIPEHALVTFRVVDANGSPVANILVTFALTNQAGGATVTPTQAISGPDGTVTTQLNAGTATGVTAVIATVPSTNSSTVSAAVTISSGIPVQSAASISATKLNIEAYNIDGVTDSINIRLGDRDGNPVPDGTTVRFSSDGGQIGASCITAGGGCSVTLTSSQPRPANGRIAILATTIGAETFTDVNGNGRYDLGEPFVDLPEAFRDDNENRKYDLGEYFQDDNANGKWDGPNGLYDGPDCVSGCGNQSATIRANMLIVFSTSQARIVFSPPAVTTHPGQTTQETVLISDLNGNIMASGTTVALTATNATLVGMASFTIGDTNARGPFAISIGVKGDDMPDTGVLTATVTSAGGIITTASTLINNTPPAPTPAALVSQMGVMPAATTLAPGETQQVPVTLTLVTEARRAVQGVTPFVRCTGDHGGPSIALVKAPLASNGDGVTHLDLTVTAPPGSTGSAQCTVTAGSASGVFEAGTK